MRDRSEHPSLTVKSGSISHVRLSSLHQWLLFGLVLATVTAVAGLAGFLIGRGQLSLMARGLPGTPPAQAQRFLPFWEAWLKIERLFYSQQPLDPTAMTYGAISGMLDSLHDPYAGFSTPPEHQMENEGFAGEFGGIGAWLARDERGTYVASLQPGSSAESAGLETGDRVLTVADKEIGMAELPSTALLIRGPVPSTVHLVVERGGAELSFDIPRLVVERASVQWSMASAAVGYVRILDFTGRTAHEFATALAELAAADARAMLLDLRGNGGGLASAAPGVLAQLVTGGIAYREVRSSGEETRVAIPFDATPPAPLPLAVLVDAGTASAAEIIAAAIQDYERGPLIGTRTYGKGSVQGLFTLKDGSSIRITTARWLTPHGRPIEGVGLQPELIAQNDQEALSLAKEYLANQAGIVVESLRLPLLGDSDGKVLV